MAVPSRTSPRRERLDRIALYRLLGEPQRVQILALCAEEELSVGELAVLLRDSQPQISRKVAPLRAAGLLVARKEGPRTWLKSHPGEGDPVLGDALEEGQRLCEKDGSLARLPALVAQREERSTAFFETAASGPEASSPSGQTLAPGHLGHLAALAPLLPGTDLAIDMGTGEGLLLDVLAPLYRRVLAVDRSPAQLARCAARVAERGYPHVSLLQGTHDDVALVQRVNALGGADLVFAARALHHVSRPGPAIAAFARLLRPGGHVALLDYEPHDDDRMREHQGDVWLGLSARELRDYCTAAGLEPVGERLIPAAFHREGPDAHLSWHAVVARKPGRSPRKLREEPTAGVPT